MESTFFVYGGNCKDAKSFENNSNIYISFYSQKGCSINVRVKFAAPMGQRQIKYRLKRKDSEEILKGDQGEPSDQYKNLQNKIKAEQEKQRTFRVKLK